MKGIRVLGVPLNVEEKHLKIYFSKKENNGGAIESIYYPLTNNDTVITFKGTEVVNRLLEIDHSLKSSTLNIHRLPENMIFTSLEAKLSSAVSALIIATPDLHDQIRYVEDIDVISTGAETQEGSADQTLCFRGNWFQLERAWHMLDCIMQQQGHFSQPGDEMSDDRSFKQPYPTNRPLEKTDVQNRAARKQQRRRPEQLGVDMFGKVETGFIKPDPSDQVSGSKPMDSLEHTKSAFYGTSVKTNTVDDKMSQDSITTGLSEVNRFRKGGTNKMRGIRVLNIPKDVEEKELKIYFSKQENNGGTIETIYYPLTNNDAVVIFEKAEVVDQLLKMRHYLKASKLTIQQLPENQIFMSMEAKLGSKVSALILATPKLQDQIRYGQSIQIISSEAQTFNQTLCLRGNWFQLEWAWHLLDDIMQQQEIIQSKLAQQGGGKFETRSEKLSQNANGLEQPGDPYSRMHKRDANDDQLKSNNFASYLSSVEGIGISPRNSHKTNRTEPMRNESSKSSHSSDVLDRKTHFNKSTSSSVLDKSTSLSSTTPAGKMTPRIKPILTVTEKINTKPFRSHKSDYTTSKLASDQRGTYSSKHKSKNSSYDDDDDDNDNFHLRSLPANLYSETYSDRLLNISSSEKADVCAICLSAITMPKELEKCKHRFCTDCIDQHFRLSKPTCPTCGTIYGTIVGDQPKNGRMEYQTKRDLLLPGYEKEDGAIVITYTFPSGKQDSSHPIPGQPYKGMERKAYLPNSREGREILRLLQKAFDARLMFTIGMSRTTGKEGVLTWNDIHHKTSIHGGPVKFGYPDPDYLRRVRDELAAKGIVSSRY